MSRIQLNVSAGGVSVPQLDRKYRDMLCHACVRALGARRKSLGQLRHFLILPKGFCGME